MLRRLRPLATFAAILISLAQSIAQTPASETADHKLEFDVASIKENKSGGEASSNIPLDRGGVSYPTGGIFSASNQSLVTLLIFAYKIKVSEFRGGLMSRLPRWAMKDKFDIVAKAESSKPGKEDMRLMVQSLLEERFKLRVHRETRQIPVLGLFLSKPGKTGPQLKAHDPSQSCSTPLPHPASGAAVSKLVSRWPATCGDGSEERTSKYVLREAGRDMTMNAIADWLTGSGESERPFLDRTGLAGTFDFIFEFDPESLGREAMSRVPRENSGPTFVEALREQLGLQVKKQQDRYISIFIVDNVEYPSEN